jgi:hypothetical protein
MTRILAYVPAVMATLMLHGGCCATAGVSRHPDAVHVLVTVTDRDGRLVTTSHRFA